MIAARYTIFLHVPLRRTGDCRLYGDKVSVAGIERYLQHVGHLSICCPEIESNDVAGLARVDRLGVAAFYPLKKGGRWASRLLNVVPNFLSAWRAVRGAEIVHLDGAEHALAMSFSLLLIRLVKRFQWIVTIESPECLLDQDPPGTTRQRLQHQLRRMLLSACLRCADTRGCRTAGPARPG